MSDVQTATAQAPAAPQPFKRKIAERDYLGPDGSVVETEEEATGVRYTQLATGRKIDIQLAPYIGKPLQVGSVVLMLAAFGGKTWAGNLVSQFKGDLDAVTARVNELADGNWPGRAPGEGPATKIDLDALAEAMAMVAEEEKRLKADDTADAYKARARQKIDDDVALRRKYRSIPAVALKYNELVGKTAASADLLAEV